MTPKERVMAVINHELVDRIPLDYWATGEVTEALMKHLGTETITDLYNHLNIDKIMGVAPRYIGPELRTHPDGSVEDFWGTRRKAQAYDTGVYWEISVWPIADAETIDDLQEYRWPNADWFDFSNIPSACDAIVDHPIQAGSVGPFYEYCNIRGIQKTLEDMALRPEFAHYVIDKIMTFDIEYLSRIFEAGRGKIDLTSIGDDFGMQDRLLMSMEMWREFYYPQFERIVNLARQYGIKVFHHDDGAVMELVPDFIELGIDVLNPIQWQCGMDLTKLKSEFGKHLCFHGGIDNQWVLPFGTTADVKQEVTRCISILASDKTGYMLAPCHNIQSNTPIENIMTMYEVAAVEGRFA